MVCRDLTVLDDLVLQAIEVIAQQSNVAPRRRKQIGGLWHASSNLPPADSVPRPLLLLQSLTMIGRLRS